MEMYNRWFHFEIEGRLEKIKNYSERVKFLYDEKYKFLSLYQGDDANQVKLMFELLIEKEKSLLKLSKINDNNKIPEPEIFLDYSNNSQAERIVFLHELGILEFLENKMTKELHGFSANKLAEIISTFTNIEQKTAQSYLNPIFTKDTIQKNNPLTNNNLEKVKNKLKNIGFNNSKSA